MSSDAATSINLGHRTLQDLGLCAETQKSFAANRCKDQFQIENFDLFMKLPPFSVHVSSIVESKPDFILEISSTTNPFCSRALQRQSRFGASPSHTLPSPLRRTTRLTSPPHSVPELESMDKKLPGKEETARKLKPRPEKTSNGGGTKAVDL